MASPYSPAPGQVLHYPQPHETLPPPIQQDFTPQQEYQPEGFEFQGGPPQQQQLPPLNQPPPIPLGQSFQPPPGQMGPMPGAIPGMIPGAQIPGAIPGTQVPGAIPGTQVPGAIPGMIPGAIPGTQVPGAIPGMIPGAIPGMIPGAVPGTQGAIPGMIPGSVPGTQGAIPGMQMPFPPPFPYDPGFQPPLWTPFHMQSLIPPDTPAHEILPPSQLVAIVPLRKDTHVDRDLALMLNKAYKYSGRSSSGHRSRRKYEKYVFLAGLLLAKRGLPAVAVPDDPEDAHVKVLQVYLSNTGRLGANPDAVLMKELAKGGGYYADEDSEKRGSRSRRRSVSSGRSKSASRRSGSRRRSKSASRRSERKSSHCSSDDTSDWDS